MNMRNLFFVFLLSVPLFAGANESADSLLKNLEGLVALPVLAIRQDYIEMYYATLRLPKGLQVSSPFITVYLHTKGPNAGYCEASLSRWGGEEIFDRSGSMIAFAKIKALFEKQEQHQDFNF